MSNAERQKWYSLSKEDLYLCSAALLGVVLLIALTTALPSGRLVLASLLGQRGGEVAAGVNANSDSKGLFDYGQSLVALSQHGAYLRFDMTLEYESAREGEESVLTPDRRKAAASMFESLRGKIDDAIISEVSRRGTKEIAHGESVGELKEDLAYSINAALKKRDVVVSGVYFTSFLLVTPESDG